MIQVQGLTKRYGERYAIRGLNFEVRQGDILGFLGPNGAGKTTTMRILTCYFPPTEGAVKIAGFDVFHNSIEVRRRVGYLPESPPLYTEMTVRGYLSFAAKIKDVPAKEVTKRIATVVDQCKLDSVQNRLINQLSKGYRQRVGLAQALIHDPPVLVLDEPTSGLDPAQIKEVRQLMRNLAEKHTVILSTHILPEVSQICRNVIIINNGQIVAQGTPERLVENVGGTLKVQLLVRGSGAKARELLEKVPGVKNVEVDPETPKGLLPIAVEYATEADPREAISRALIQEGFGLAELSVRGISLEDIYLRLVTGGEAPAVAPASKEVAA